MRLWAVLLLEHVAADSRLKPDFALPVYQSKEEAQERFPDRRLLALEVHFENQPLPSPETVGKVPRSPEGTVPKSSEGARVIPKSSEGARVIPSNFRVREETAVQQGFTGESCINCGSWEVVRSGTCSTCRVCGSTTSCG